MKIYSDFFKKQSFTKKGIIAIGYYDSVHLGHQKILKELVEISAKNKLSNFVLTFKNLPKKDVNNRSILELDKRLEIIKSFGVKNIISCDFDNNFSKLTASEFLKKLRENFNISDFIVGKDFSFGNNNSGNIDTLKNEGFNIHITSPYIVKGKEVSTSEIREAVSSGDIEKANSLMERAFFIEGIVNKGKQLGRTIGFPTMNINNSKIIYPQSGTYITKTIIKDLEFYSMTYVTDNIIETNLIGYSDFHYNFKIKIDFLRKIRDNEPFMSFNDLKKQLILDLEKTKKYFNLMK